MINIASRYANGFTPRDNRELDDWARQHIKVGAWSPWEGDFTTDRTPWIVEPMRVLGRPGPRRVTMLGPAAGSKSTVSEVFLAWAIDNAPGFTVWYCQDEDAAKEFAETRVNRFLDSCERVSRWFPAGGARHKKRTQAIHFPHMSFVIQAANEGNVQSKHIRHLVLDEPWMYDAGMMSAAHDRTARFSHNRTIIETSTGSNKGDETDQAFNQGTRQEWQFLCPKCGAYHAPKWTFGRYDEPGGVKWSQTAKLTDGTWDLRAVAKSTYYQCPKCKHDFAANSANGYLLNKHGQYSAPAVDAMPEHWSFHWNCIASEFAQLGKFAVKFLLAKAAIKRGTTALLEEFTRKALAEAWEDSGAGAEMSTTLAGTYLMGEAWPDEVVRFMTIDVQQSHFWYVIRAWAANGHSRLVRAGRAETWGELRDLQEANAVQDRYVFADSSHYSGSVYKECCLYDWNAVKGVEALGGFTVKTESGRSYKVPVKEAEGRGIPVNPHHNQRVSTCLLLAVSEDMTSDTLRLFRSGTAEGWSLPADVSEEYTAQLASRVKRPEVVKSSGQTVWKWHTIGKQGEHLWDCERYQIAAAWLSGMLYTGPEKEKTE